MSVSVCITTQTCICVLCVHTVGEPRQKPAARGADAAEDHVAHQRQGHG